MDRYVPTTIAPTALGVLFSVKYSGRNIIGIKFVPKKGPQYLYRYKVKIIYVSPKVWQIYRSRYLSLFLFQSVFAYFLQWVGIPSVQTTDPTSSRCSLHVEDRKIKKAAFTIVCGYD